MQRHLATRYLVPQPRNALAEALRRHATAAMDVSDGLAGDLGKLCGASGVAAEVEIARVPLSRAARAALAAEARLMETVLAGGDDFEVIATVPPAALDKFHRAAMAVGVPVTVIGRVMAGNGARFLGPDGKPLRLKRTSFSHF
jgi:thiamine-monophosphate kinase